MARPDHPPGRNREGPPAVTPGSPHPTTTPTPPSAEAAPRIPPFADIGWDEVPPLCAGLLFMLSDERDTRLEVRKAAWRDGWRTGRRAGYEAGYRTGYELAVREWKITALGMTNLGGATWADMDCRRYPPDGRLAWILPRPGDDTGSQHG